jgi:hypothetical protein
MNRQDERGASFFPERGIYRWLLLIAIFSAALGVRLYNAGAPPLDFYPVRQYRAAMLARAFYYESAPESVSEKVRKEALASKPKPLEPPITEMTASLIYRAVGGEHLIIPRLLSIVFWMIAAVFLYRLATEMISPDAGMVATAFFLFLPLGVAGSRSFQPDPLMIMFFMATIYSIFRYYRSPSGYGLAAACLFSALAIFVKPTCVFPILSVFVAMRIPSKNIRNILFGRDLVIFVAASLLPSFIYYGYGIFVADFLKYQAESSFVPGLLTKSFYWVGWYYMVSGAIGRYSLFIAVLGVFLIRSVRTRYYILGLWVGYVLFCLAFSNHIRTHLYYHLVLIPIVALSIGVLASYILEALSSSKGVRRLGVWALFVLPILLSFQISLKLTSDSGFDGQVKAYRDIGEKVNHSTKTVLFDPHDGDRVMYYGRVYGVMWPLKNLGEYSTSHTERPGGKEMLDEIIAEYSPEYFIVTNIPQLEQQAELKKTLDIEYPVLAESITPGREHAPLDSEDVRYVIPKVPGGESPDYIIYDLRHKKNSDAPGKPE